MLIGTKIRENSFRAPLWRGLEYFCQYVQRKLSRVMKSFNFRIVAENVSYCHDIPRTCQIENKCYAKICCSGIDFLIFLLKLRISLKTIYVVSKVYDILSSINMLKSWLITYSFLCSNFSYIDIAKSWKEIQLSFIKPFLMIAKWQKKMIYYNIRKKMKFFAGNKN